VPGVSDHTPQGAPSPEDAPAKKKPLPPPVDPTEGIPTARLVRSLVVYLVLAFGLAWAVAGAVYLHYGADALRTQPKTLGDHLVLEFALWGMMLCPAVAAFIVRGLVVRQPLRDLGLAWGLYRGWLLAFAIPLAIVTAAFVISYLATPAHFDWALTHYRELVASRGQDLAKFDKMPKAGLHAIFFVQAVLVGPVLGLPFALGEELGWRGHLTPILMRLLGRPAGLVVAGAIWGLWHLPIILMGHNYPQHPWLGAGLFVGFCVLLSPVLQWLFEVSGSALAPALGHGVINQATSYFVMTTVGYQALTVGTLGWPGYLALAVAGGLAFRRFLRGRGERRRAMGSLARLAS